MVLGGPLLGALATVDVSRDETNTGAELSLYVTIVHRCSVSGEARLVYFYLCVPLCCCSLGLLQWEARRVGGWYPPNPEAEQRALRPYVYIVVRAGEPGGARPCARHGHAAMGGGQAVKYHQTFARQIQQHRRAAADGQQQHAARQPACAAPPSSVGKKYEMGVRAAAERFGNRSPTAPAAPSARSASSLHPLSALHRMPLWVS